MPLPDTIAAVLDQKGHDVWSVPPDASVFETIALMADRQVGALLVMSGDRLVGIVSERDYARKVILQGKSSKDTRVREIMTSPVVFVSPRHTVHGCMKIMSDRRIRHLPVLEDDRVVGMLSLNDLVTWIMADQDETIHQLEAYITGKYPG